MTFINLIKNTLVLFAFIATPLVNAQETQEENNNDKSPGYFSFGSGIGANYNNGYMSISVSPMLIYNFNDTFGTGVGYNFTKGFKSNQFNTTINGGSLIALANVFANLQVSAEFERSNVDIDYNESLANSDKNFWYSALFLGAGITKGNVLMGIRYNVLYKDTDNNVYPSPLIPYVRVLF